MNATGTFKVSRVLDVLMWKVREAVKSSGGGGCSGGGHSSGDDSSGGGCATPPSKGAKV